MVTAKDISIKFANLSKPGGKFLVGDTVSGKLEITVPGQLAVWRIELKMGNQRLSLANDTLLRPGTNTIPFTFPQPLTEFDYKGGHFNLEHHLKLVLHPSRIRNELNGDAYLRKFGVDSSGGKSASMKLEVLRGDARYRIAPRPLLLNGKNRSWWLFLLAVLFGSAQFVPQPDHLPLIILAAFLPVLFLLEGDYVGRHLFGHLLAEIRTDHKGFPHLYLEPRGAGEEFLDAYIGFRIRMGVRNGDDVSQSTIFEKKVKIRDKAQRLGKRFLVPLPFPPGTIPATYKHYQQFIEWEFTLEYRRPWAKTVRFRIPVDVELRPLEPVVDPELLGEEDILELPPLTEKQSIRLKHG